MKIDVLINHTRIPSIERLLSISMSTGAKNKRILFTRVLGMHIQEVGSPRGNLSTLPPKCFFSPLSFFFFSHISLIQQIGLRNTIIPRFGSNQFNERKEGITRITHGEKKKTKDSYFLVGKEG